MQGVAKGYGAILVFKFEPQIVRSLNLDKHDVLLCQDIFHVEDANRHHSESEKTPPTEREYNWDTYEGDYAIYDKALKLERILEC